MTNIGIFSAHSTRKKLMSKVVFIYSILIMAVKLIVQALNMKIENKTIRQYENVEDEHHCVVNMFVKYVSSVYTQS